jgi:hypothetical protein
VPPLTRRNSPYLQLALPIGIEHREIKLHARNAGLAASEHIAHALNGDAILEE